MTIIIIFLPTKSNNTFSHAIALLALNEQKRPPGNT